MKNLAFTCLAGLCLVAAGCGGNKTKQATTSTSEGQTSTAPSGTTAANAKVALVRFVDAIPGRPANLAFGDNQIFSDIAYRTVTPYKEVPGERHDFKLMAGQGAVTNSEGLTNGQRYTVVAALDKNGREKLDVLNDNMTAPANGKAKLRVINASREEVDVYAPVSKSGNPHEGTAERAKHPDLNHPYADESKWFSGVNPVSSTSFKDVEPYDGDLNVVPSARNNRRRAEPAAHVAVNMKAGDLYTVVVAGGQHGQPLTAMDIDDHLNGQTANR